jgi:hypothetical protein
MIDRLLRRVADWCVPASAMDWGHPTVTDDRPSLTYIAPPLTMRWVSDGVPPTPAELADAEGLRHLHLVERPDEDA